jgi:hypothetical protein
MFWLLCMQFFCAIFVIVRTNTDLTGRVTHTTIVIIDEFIDVIFFLRLPKGRII